MKSVAHIFDEVEAGHGATFVSNGFVDLVKLGDSNRSRGRHQGLVNYDQVEPSSGCGRAFVVDQRFRHVEERDEADGVTKSSGATEGFSNSHTVFR